MKIVGVLLLTILACVGAVGYLSWGEKESNSFVNYKSVVESGLVTRGWVPSFIPSSSHNIKEHHAVDAPYIYLELYFDPEDIGYFEKSCELVAEGQYKCANAGNPVKVTITNGNHAVIESI